MSLTQVSTVHERARRAVAAGQTDLWSNKMSEFMRHVALNRVTVAVLDTRNRITNWDGNGSARADERAISRAVAMSEEFIAQAFDANLEWTVPHVGLNEAGEVSFEWWNGSKKLTLYVGPTSIHYVSSWGPHIEEEMDAGELSEHGFVSKWRWFQHRDN